MRHYANYLVQCVNYLILA